MMRKPSRKSFVLLALCITVAGVAYVWHATPESQRSVVQQQAPPPEPTALATLQKLKQLGARWKRNQHGQVYWLFLKRLPLADDDLTVLKELPEVQTLTLRGVHTIKGNHFTDDGLRHVGQLKKLRYLDLSVNYQLTDAGLRHLESLKQLEYLDLSGCRRFSDACGASLAQLTSLRTLKLRQTSLTPDVLTALSQLPELKHLAVKYAKGMWLNENTIVPLEKMPLEELEGMLIKDENLPLIARLKSLKSLPFEQGRSIKDDQLSYLIHIRQIKKLNVVLTRGTSDTSQLIQLQALPELETLSISLGKRSEGDPLDRSGLLVLAKFPALKELGIGLVNVPVLEAISHCTQVQKLNLNVDSSQFQPTDLAYLKEMSSLKSITVQIALVSDDLWATLGKVKSLEEISFNRGWPPQKEPPPFSMTSLKQLQNLPHLKGLDLNGFPVTDEGLGYLGQCRTLERLGLNNAPITNAGLLQLRHLSQLKKFSFYGSKIDRKPAEELHQFIPQCEIEDNWCCGCMTIYADRRFTQK
ncbi:MAG TPA: hypothetical protein DIT97_16565 [Gimesia maris]|uniref:Leucine Rich repeats (2 copies) n=1 Tax=Gimesia maris TaxID=122 RepID=A0A3D3R8Y8_9PLAN|nr:hypothetical protein [Gimesia maris]|tara:strand:- start:12187 stop:13767 length:1581 start_codon:yes stop_codon:yes gene_type:complete